MAGSRKELKAGQELDARFDDLEPRLNHGQRLAGKAVIISGNLATSTASDQKSQASFSTI